MVAFRYCQKKAVARGSRVNESRSLTRLFGPRRKGEKMLVKNWMTPEVITVSPDTSLLKTGKILKESNVRRVPVVDNSGAVIGIISDRDVKDASPSKATTLDMYEMHYLLAEIKARQIMTKNPITIKSSDTVEKAAMIMLDNKIGGLPVVDDGKLVGIISDQDVFKALVNITGAREGGAQLGISLENKLGAMRPILDLIRNRGGRIISILSANNDAGERTIFLRIKNMNSREEEDALVEEVKKFCKLLYFSRDERFA